MQPNLHVLHLHLHIPVLLEQSYLFGDEGFVSVAQSVVVTDGT